MADQFRIQQSITFIQQTPPETYRLMETNIIDLPLSHNNAKSIIPASTTNLKIADNVNIFIMNSSKGIILKIGSSSNPSIENVSHFSYKGSKTSFFISNQTTEDITITYSTCSI